MIIPVKHNLENGFAVARLHYSLDPNKDAAWVERMKRGMPESGWLREYEIDYSTFAGKPVLPEFKYELNAVEMEKPQREILYCGWDFGYHRPRCLITFLNEFDQWCWHKAIWGKDEGIEKFGERVAKYLLSEYPGCKYLHGVDPAGHQKNDKSEKTSIQVLESFEIFCQSRPSSVVEGVEIIRQKLLMRDDGKVGLLVNKDEEDLIDGFRGGYRYAEARIGQAEKEEPLADGFYQDTFDAARYIAVNYFSLVEYSKQSGNPITADELLDGPDPNRNMIEQGGGIADMF